ncbi:excinuclease ABC subunit UvrA [Marispirochaeta sp.]|uniref:excinuclease ABC subunit UvrA n=1 Tax=Marispirochaeta sp. TaxID=2038653 RepID=UPI0029C6D215|nr:excinuclease ABC subunit UvrA [Marispirochaeta sp.]
MKKLIVKGAREHNLKNIDLELPRDSLIVISGLSGSGKSSLAFDTIFAEGQRRYVESLSAYARQFLGRMDKPDVDYIEGLSPAISIEQKTTHRNPRSTVGTVTEVYDYMRLLYARIGIPHCPVCGKEIREQSVDQILDTIMDYPEGSRIMLMAPVVRGKKGEHRKIIEDAAKAGFVRMRVDGEISSLDEEIVLNKKQKHTLEIIVDRLKIQEDARKRLAESVETALEVADGQIIVLRMEKSGNKEEFFSQKNSCPDCGISIPELQPRLFSFNNPFGACEVCAGLGMTMEFDPALIIPDPSLSFNEGAIKTHNPDSAWHRSWFESLADHFGFDLDTPIQDLDKDIWHILLHGSEDVIDVTYVNRKKTGRFEYSTNFKGIINDLNRRYRESRSPGIKDWLEGFMRQQSCTACGGKRLKPEALAVTVGGENVHSLTCRSVQDLLDFFDDIQLTTTEKHISAQIMKEIVDRLTFMKKVGLEYLTLERQSATLSGGEAQRIRLATQVGSQLVGVLYILDEPTIGLHQRDNQRLIETLCHLRDIGNTLIVVEHDDMTIRTADYIVDLGPGAGIHGGYITAHGTLEQVLKAPDSLTGQYLRGELSIPVPAERRRGNGKEITIYGAAEHNLKHIDVSFALGTFTAITGVSGSGKSTLMENLLFPILRNAVSHYKLEPGVYDRVEGVEEVDKIINIDQSPIGRTPRSNPATYVGLFTPIRELFASLPESRARGYKAGRFSFNVKGGRCENCQGDGTIKIEMHFLPDVYVTCDVCKGKRFNRETLDVRYKGKNIHDVLDMSVEEALEFFEKIPSVNRRLETLQAVGLNYVKLGQSALTLSGGEAQRVKLSLELSKRSTGKTFYILDEPTTGLHFADVKKLLEVLQMLVDKGNTVVLIEHNLDVIKQADYIIDLGPEGGVKGGHIVAKGTPEEILEVPGSYTAHYLREVMK